MIICLCRYIKVILNAKYLLAALYFISYGGCHVCICIHLQNLVVRYIFQLQLEKILLVHTCNSVIHLFSFLLDMYLKRVEFEDFFLSENPRTSSKSMAKNYIKRYIVPENHHLHPGAPWPSIERSPFLPLEKCPFIKDYL